MSRLKKDLLLGEYTHYEVRDARRSWAEFDSEAEARNYIRDRPRLGLFVCKLTVTIKREVLR